MVRKGTGIRKWLEKHGETSSCKRGAPIQYEVLSRGADGRELSYVVETCFNKKHCKPKTFRTISPSGEKIEPGQKRKSTLRLLCCTKPHTKGDKCPVSQETQHIKHPVAAFKKKHPAIWRELQKRGGLWETGARTSPTSAPKRKRRR